MAALDSLARFLSVAGWPSAAHEARTIRDDVLAGIDLALAGRRMNRLTLRMRRSVGLRRMGDGLARVDDAGADVAGDVTARWRRWLREAAEALEHAERKDETGHSQLGSRTSSAERLAVACRFMVGVDVAAARLVMASVDPDPDELSATGLATGAVCGGRGR